MSGANAAADQSSTTDTVPMLAPRWNAGPPQKAKGSPARPIIGALVSVGVFATLYIIGQSRALATKPALMGGGSPDVQIEYHLTGSARIASVITYTDANGNIQQETNVPIPLETTSAGGGITFRTNHGAFLQFSAQNGGDSGDLTCIIDADGKVVNTGHASGGAAIVQCSVIVP